jgi:hypothetical protein
MIRQCTVLEEFEIILILTENVRLFHLLDLLISTSSSQDLCAYDLESCVPTISTRPRACHPPRKLNSKGKVSFFRVGMINGDAYIIFSRKKMVRESPKKYVAPPRHGSSPGLHRWIQSLGCSRWCDRWSRARRLRRQTRSKTGFMYTGCVRSDERLGPVNLRQSVGIYPVPVLHRRSLLLPQSRRPPLQWFQCGQPRGVRFPPNDHV